MYAIRPYTTENIELDLPTSMYSVQPILQQRKEQQSNLKAIEQRQDILLEKIATLFNQLLLYQKQESNGKTAALSQVHAVREELVVHLSAKQPSKNILNLIEQFREKLSIRTFRHSSLHDNAFNSPVQNSPISSSNNRKLTIIWAEGENLPFMFHARMKITDEQTIINLLSEQIAGNE